MSVVSELYYVAIFCPIFVSFDGHWWISSALYTIRHLELCSLSSTFLPHVCDMLSVWMFVDVFVVMLSYWMTFYVCSMECVGEDIVTYQSMSAAFSVYLSVLRVQRFSAEWPSICT